MPTKGSFTSNVFEDLKDLGKSTVKSAASAVAKPLNPLNIINEIVAPKSGEAKTEEQIKQEALKGQSSTPLDFGKLSDKYKENDQAKIMAVRKQFDVVKEDEQKAIDERKKEEQERLQKIAQEEQEKKRREQEQQQANQAGPAPQGKQKRGMFGAKKKAQMQHQETKPSVGKQ